MLSTLSSKYTMAVHEVEQSNLPQALCASPPMSCTPTDGTPPLDVVGQCLKSGLCFPEASLNEGELVGGMLCGPFLRATASNTEIKDARRDGRVATKLTGCRYCD